MIVVEIEERKKLSFTRTFPATFTNAIRALVSKSKRRYKEDGYDLDLTYIEPKLIVMGFPSFGNEGIYRNNAIDVRDFLDSKHYDRYKIYNLCSERNYPIDFFYGRVCKYPFEDHNPPPMRLFRSVCEDIYSWHAENPENVVAIHCKAGKGRSGVIACAYLLYIRRFENAEECMQHYGLMRTKNEKGITIPSQRRFLNYFGQLCERDNYKKDSNPSALSFTFQAGTKRPSFTDPLKVNNRFYSNMFMSNDDDDDDFFLNMNQYTTNNEGFMNNITITPHFEICYQKDLFNLNECNNYINLDDIRDHSISTNVINKDTKSSNNNSNLNINQVNIKNNYNYNYNSSKKNIFNNNSKSTTSKLVAANKTDVTESAYYHDLLWMTSLSPYSSIDKPGSSKSSNSSHGKEESFDVEANKSDVEDSTSMINHLPTSVRSSVFCPSPLVYHTPIYHHTSEEIEEKEEEDDDDEDEEEEEEIEELDQKNNTNQIPNTTSTTIPTTTTKIRRNSPHHQSNNSNNSNNSFQNILTKRRLQQNISLLSLHRGEVPPSRPIILYQIELHKLISTKANNTSLFNIAYDPSQIVFKIKSKSLNYEFNNNNNNNNRNIHENIIIFQLPNITVTDEFLLIFYNKSYQKKNTLFYCWFHTAFIYENETRLNKFEIDKAHKDKSHKKFPKDFYLSIFCKEEFE